MIINLSLKLIKVTSVFFFKQVASSYVSENAPIFTVFLAASKTFDEVHKSCSFI